MSAYLIRLSKRSLSIWIIQFDLDEEKGEIRSEIIGRVNKRKINEDEFTLC